MSEKKDPDIEFAKLFGDAKPLINDKYVMTKQERMTQLAAKKLNSRPKSARKDSVSIEISDDFEAYWPEGKPIKYLRPIETQNSLEIDKHFERISQDIRHDWLKKLSKAMIPPELEIDLHGMRALDAKHEIIRAISLAKHKSYLCLQIIHGHGQGVLKHKIPNWLIQHPDVAAFVRAPRQYGGNSALLVLISSATTKS